MGAAYPLSAGVATMLITKFALQHKYFLRPNARCRIKLSVTAAFNQGGIFVLSKKLCSGMTCKRRYHACNKGCC